MNYIYHDSPIGCLLLAADDEALCLISFPEGSRKQQPKTHWQQHRTALLDNACQQLDAYFDAQLTMFDLPLAPQGTAFQCQVWQALQQVPFGETRSYGELAQNIGRPKASRAVGAANGANPLPIVIPCHRIIGANGSLTGFGGGLSTKRWLLIHEGILPDADSGQLSLF